MKEFINSNYDIINAHKNVHYYIVWSLIDESNINLSLLNIYSGQFTLEPAPKYYYNNWQTRQLDLSLLNIYSGQFTLKLAPSCYKNVQPLDWLGPTPLIVKDFQKISI